MSVNLKARKQERQDLQTAIKHREALQANLLEQSNEGDFTSEQEEQYESIQASLDEDRERLAQVNKIIERAENIQQAEMDAASSSRTSANENYAEPAHKPYVHGKVVERAYFKGLGNQLQAIYKASTGRASQRDLAWLNQIDAAVQGANEGVGAEGGFLVQQDFAASIFDVMRETGQLLQRVTSQPVEGNGLNIPAVNGFDHSDGSVAGGIEAFWEPEGGSATATQPKFYRISLMLKKLFAFGYATDEMLADATALGNFFQSRFAMALRLKAEDAIINGSGAGQPLGILNSDALVTVSAESGQSANTIVAENISNMWSRAWADSRPNMVWLINQDVEPQLDQLSINIGTGGSAVYVPQGGFSTSPFATLKGRPVIPTQYCPSLGSVGDIMLVDLSQYQWIDKNGVQNDSSMHVAFQTGQMAFRAIYRADGRPLWSDVVTPLNSTNTRSPFVALAAR